MPQDGLFFRVLRRANLILWLCIGLGVAVAGGHSIWKDVQREHELMGIQIPLSASTSAATPVPTAPNGLVMQSEAYASEFGSYGQLQSDIYVLRKVTPHQPSPEGAYMPYTPAFLLGDAVNLMVIDAQTGEGHWLFNSAPRNIVTRAPVYEGVPTMVAAYLGADPRPVIGLVLWVAESDSDKDKALTAKDAMTLYFWKKGTSELVKLVHAEAVDGARQVGADRYIVTYYKGNDLVAATYKLPDMKLVSEKVLPAIPK